MKPCSATIFLTGFTLLACAQTKTEELPLETVLHGRGISVALPGSSPLRASVSDKNVHQLFPRGDREIFIHYMPWWGKSEHIDIGVDQRDSKVIDTQLQEIIRRGFDGVIVTESHSGDFNSETTHLVFRAVQQRPGFRFAVMYNKGGLSTTDALIQSLKRDAKDYFRSDHYYAKDGHPLVFFFDRPDAIDFTRAASSLAPAPWFIFRNPSGFTASGSSGAFAWLADTHETNEAYTLRFHDASRSSKGFAMESVWKGFDDRRASWSKNRVIAERCGSTFLEAVERAKAGAGAVQFNTWNDYEEGTDLEQGIDNCGKLNITISGPRLLLEPRFASEGTLETIDSFALYAVSADQTAVLLETSPSSARSFDLSRLKITPGSMLVVQMVGKPLFRNVTSNFVEYASSRH